ncbi:type II toxin-antitoxin system RelE family toxin [Candidatus Contendibacter odensensis]|uniref:Toxin RelE2 n=1 Tax=Candidatus Contendobacter odensis Run_B_J11 TaxID=1400861 RepID=A0A7U7J2J9_9GAMM|nr:type II toxin-antitoxin system RelE/ParE family toxin [Candidatus Contendobacter odensis]MBK8751501.1 type II toxin-antitoxin system RelE/ParE family toxin [Candidatus Competibacteraceae bacterium]CDH43553.1 putative toxin RelE2 [Candidatus Contendobacter odensis Run_B_J11]
MNVIYQKKFLKQLAQIPSDTRVKIEKFSFEDLPLANSIAEIGKIEKMQGYSDFYKVRFGSYRVGIRTEGDNLILKVVMDRKEIDKFFP